MMNHAVIEGNDKLQFQQDLNVASKEGWVIHTFSLLRGEASLPVIYYALVVKALPDPEVKRPEGMGSRDKPLAAK